MPLKKQRTVKSIYLRNQHKNAIKRRLMEISIRVDYYIYKNKPITVQECEKYIEELSIHRTQCYNDVFILQVIEKLTRCIKTITEETIKNVPLNGNPSSSNINRSVEVFNASSLSNKATNNNAVITDEDNLPEIVDVVSKNKNEKSGTTIVTVISDNENEENDNNNKGSVVSIEKKSDIFICGYSNFKDNEKNNELTSLNFHTHRSYVNTKRINSINDVTTKHVLTNTNVSQSIPTHINIQTDKTLKPDQPDDHPVQLDDINITRKPNETINENDNLTQHNSRVKRKYKKKGRKIINNTEILQIISPLVQKTKTKNNKTGVTENPVNSKETLNLDLAIKANTPELRDAGKKIKRASKKNVKTTLQPATKPSARGSKGRKRPSDQNNSTTPDNVKEDINPSTSYLSTIFSATQTKCKHTNINVISDEVAIPILKEYKVSSSNLDSVAGQMGALKIYNECVPNDLSWIENIRYVREISNDEFEVSSNRFNDIFWNNFSLPNDYKDVDFRD